MGDSDASDCGECGEEVKDKGIQCDICSKWFHAECVGLQDALYKAIKQYGGGHKWLCKACDKKVGGILNNMIEIKAKRERLEKELRTMKNEVREKQDKMEREMIEIKKTMGDVEKESKKQEKNIVELNEELVKERKSKKELEQQVQAELIGLKKDVGELGTNVETQKARYDEVLKTGMSKEKLQADPGRVIEEKRGRKGNPNTDDEGNGER
jgi:chromosome segregation ATPase